MILISNYSTFPALSKAKKKKLTSPIMQSELDRHVDSAVRELSNPGTYAPCLEFGSNRALEVLNGFCSATGVEGRNPSYRGPLRVQQHLRPAFMCLIDAVVRVFPEKNALFKNPMFLHGFICISDIAHCCRDQLSGACKFCEATAKRTGERVTELYAVDQRVERDGKTFWQSFEVKRVLADDGRGAFAPQNKSFAVGHCRLEASKNGRSLWNTDEAKTTGLKQCPHQRTLFGCKYHNACVMVHVHPDGSATASPTGYAQDAVGLISMGNGYWKVPDAGAVAAAAPAAAAPAVNSRVATLDAETTALETRAAEMRKRIAELKVQTAALELKAAEAEAAAKNHAAAPAAAPAAAAAAPAPASAAEAVTPHVTAARAQRQKRNARREERKAAAEAAAGPVQ